MKKFIADTFSSWRAWEVVYAFVCTGAIAGISFYLGDSLAGISSAVAGTLYTILAGKGKAMCYVFGIINTLIYGYIARSHALYGDMMLNWFIYLPMMLAGLVVWQRKSDDCGNVIKTALSRRGRVMLLGFLLAGTAVYAYILHRMGDVQPAVDSATTILSVAAMAMTLKRCIEQWILWTLVNGLSVVMWVRVYVSGGNSIATLLWWVIMLITGIIFFIQWYMAVKRECRA